MKHSLGFFTIHFHSNYVFVNYDKLIMSSGSSSLLNPTIYQKKYCIVYLKQNTIFCAKNTLQEPFSEICTWGQRVQIKNESQHKEFSLATTPTCLNRRVVAEYALVRVSGLCWASLWDHESRKLLWSRWAHFTPTSAPTRADTSRDSAGGGRVMKYEFHSGFQWQHRQNLPLCCLLIL